MEQAKWNYKGKNVQLLFSFPLLPLIAGITYRYSGLVVFRNSIKKEKAKAKKKKPAKLYLKSGTWTEFCISNDGYYWYTEHLERILEEIANFCKRK